LSVAPDLSSEDVAIVLEDTQKQSELVEEVTKQSMRQSMAGYTQEEINFNTRK
jgi:hypothetical protein